MGSRSRLPGAVSATLVGVLAVAAAAGASPRRETSHVFPVALSASPHDATLLEIRFPHGGRRALTPETLQVRVAGAFGDDYMALAAPRRTGRRGPEALLVLANRPSPLLDPAPVRLRLSARSMLGKPVLAHLADVLSGARVHPPAGLCPLGSKSLGAATFTPLGHRGTTLSGISIIKVVAGAYDAACASNGAAVQALRSALAAEPAAEGSPGEPAPAPPVPGPPRCTPCDPAPGFACPLVASVAVCVASRDEKALAAH